MMEVTLWGTRGSLASPGPDTARHGGNTACVEVRCDDHVIILDAGTGIRRLGANLPEDAIYPANLADSTGKPLDGGNKYTIHFDKAAIPPVDAFWSITLYDDAGFQVANKLNRFAVGSWMPFKYNADGSLDLYFQNESPGAENEANWLPAPKGPFFAAMRLYWPKPDALDGKWKAPPLQRAN